MAILNRIDFERNIHYTTTQVKSYLNIRDKHLNDMIDGNYITPIGRTGTNKLIFDKHDIMANKDRYREIANNIKFNAKKEISLIQSAIIQVDSNNKIIHSGVVKQHINNDYFLVEWFGIISTEHNVSTLLHISEMASDKYYILNVSDAKEIINNSEYVKYFPYKIKKESK